MESGETAGERLHREAGILVTEGANFSPDAGKGLYPDRRKSDMVARFTIDACGVTHPAGIEIQTEEHITRGEE